MFTEKITKPCRETSKEGDEVIVEVTTLGGKILRVKIEETNNPEKSWKTNFRASLLDRFPTLKHYLQ